MAERRLNFNAPLLSTRRLQTAGVSVRRNKKMMIDNSKTSDCPVPICRPDMGLDQVTELASVPFTWEQIPGRLKDDSLRSESCDSRKDFVSPKLPPGKVIDILKCPLEKDFEGQIAARPAIDVDMTRLQGPEAGQVLERQDEDSDVFSDALDTLSPNDSCSENRSITGVSGYGMETKKKPILFEDPQSRDFMLTRFLPAAKAMTLEQPQYAAKKQRSAVMSEPTRQIREIVAVEKRPTFNRYESTSSPYYYQDVNDEESDEDEDDAYDYASSANISKRGCGLLPQLCFRNSLGMLNTVPGLKAKPNSLITSSHDQVKSSKVAQLKSRIQSVKKLALDSVYKQKSGTRAQSPMHHPSVGNKLNLGSEQFGSNPATAIRSSSPYGRFGCLSPYRNAGNSSPIRQVGFPGTLKEAENLRANRLNKHIKNVSRSQELLYPKSTRQGCPASSVIEKTVYVDTENSPETNNQQNSSIKSLSETLESSLPRAETVSEEADTAGNKLDVNLEHGSVENLSVTSGKILKVAELETINSGYELSHLAPPLPKKPSESWLLRNLPSVSSRIPSSSFPFHPQQHDPEENSNSVTKWETIVKTSYLHKDHVRYSEELVAHASRKSKT